MKTPPKRDTPREVTTEDVEAALHAALRDEGHLVPRTEDDVADLEASLDLSNVPTPDTLGFRQMLREHAAGNVVPFKHAEPDISTTVAENLAMAARNGGEIPDEIRRKMDADRQAAEGHKAPLLDGTR